LRKRSGARREVTVGFECGPVICERNAKATNGIGMDACRSVQIS